VSLARPAGADLERDLLPQWIDRGDDELGHIVLAAAAKADEQRLPERDDNVAEILTNMSPATFPPTSRSAI
jgi:hypothetical protein